MFSHNGMAAIVRCREERPEIYLRIVASLLPKQKAEQVNPFDEWTDDELAELAAWLEARR